MTVGIVSGEHGFDWEKEKAKVHEKRKPMEFILDNGGKTADRYTVIIGNEVRYMSHDANAPNGVNMYAGEMTEMKDCIVECLMTGKLRAVHYHELPEGTKFAIRKFRKMASENM